VNEDKRRRDKRKRKDENKYKISTTKERKIERTKNDTERR
jgi:hypothetical protein